MDTLKPGLRSGIISAEVPDQDGTGNTQLVFDVHRNAQGLNPRVTVTAMDRPDLKDRGETIRRAQQMGQAWLLVMQNTALIVQMDEQRRAEAKTKPIQ